MLATAVRAADPGGVPGLGGAAAPSGGAGAESPPGRPLSRPSGTAAVLVLGHRVIAVLRAEVGGYPPGERARGAAARFAEALGQGGPSQVAVKVLPEGRLIEVDGEFVIAITPDDVFTPGGETLDGVARRAAQRMERVIAEHRESRSPGALARAAGLALLATTLYVLGVRCAFLARRRLARAVMTTIEGRASARRLAGILGLRARQLLAGARRLVSLVLWTLVVGVTYVWVTYVLERFAVSRAWGERMHGLLSESVTAFPLALIEALPNLLVVIVIFAVTRILARLVRVLLDAMAAGRVGAGWLGADTARPTARILVVLLWLFALAMAYPYFPGAQTDAFKGLSVLVGVMVSLGASSSVGHAVSGLILMYSGAIRVGDYVLIGETEGTVTQLTLFATRVRTGMGAEVTLPSSHVLSTAIVNYSRAGEGGGFVLDTSVTIGYDTPWRQVHAMLVEAARRTPGVLADPAPYVVQTALADFFVEYRLVAHAGPEAPQARAHALNLLHASIQDVFNEHGVQIMSPHYMVDPAAPKVVPRARWHAPPAAPPGGEVRAR
jgi:small-conductance mechanosensitive channel